MPGYTTTYRYTIERHPKDEEAAIYWVRLLLNNVIVLKCI